MINSTDASFIDFRIIKINFAVNTAFNGSGQATVRTEFKMRHELHNNRLRVFLAIFFDDKSAPFSINIEGMGTFELSCKFNENELENLCSDQCAITIFPYMRETIADITRRAGFPPLQIPQINFQQVFSKQREDNHQHTLH